MLIPVQNSNKANYKIQDCFANRQIKEDVKCNSIIKILRIFLATVVNKNILLKWMLDRKN
jgi:hypothetical protein